MANDLFLLKVAGKCIKIAKRIYHLGGPRGIKRKLESKAIERKARLKHGTQSFPNEEERKEQRAKVFPKDVTFSILVPLYNTPESFLREMIDSVVAQTYEKWELCLADGSDSEHSYVGEIVTSYMEKDPRIKYQVLPENYGISGNTNACYKMATGNYIGLFDHDDLLHPAVLYEYMQVICEKDADFIYCDETTFDGDSVDHMITLHFKPDFSIDNLRGNNYICHFSVFTRELAESLNCGTDIFRSAYDGSQDHDLILRLTANAKTIVHVPKLLYYWRSHAGSTAADLSVKSYAIDAAKNAVKSHLESQGFRNFEISSTEAFETIFRIKYEVLGAPKISIIVPNKNHLSDLKRLVDSIFQKSTYENFELLVVENGSDDSELFSYYKELENRYNGKVKVLTWEKEFNYSAINNFAAAKATGEYLLLLNNDTEVITPDWMQELLMYAQREDVGCVGCKLLYPDHTIQHAGIVIGLGAHRTAGHTHYLVSEKNYGYMGRLCFTQNVTAVTGACLMVKKAIFNAVQGLDESFKVSLNDVDLCLRVRKLGFLNVCTPFAELFHYESASRGSDLSGVNAERYNEESARFREKWKAELAAGDPYYNPNFSLDRSDYALKL